VFDFKGWASLCLLLSSRLNAGLGVARSWVAVAVVLFERFEVSGVEDLAAMVCATALFKGSCAFVEVVENRRAHCAVRRAFRLPVLVSIVV
jgi:hypothetical protein